MNRELRTTGLGLLAVAAALDRFRVDKPASNPGV